MNFSSHLIFSMAFILTMTLRLGAAGQASAHGSGWSQESGFAVVLSFYYTDQTPMAYSEVRIFSPADPDIPYQKGRSDRNGFFSFKPDASGRWSFSAADGQGHLSKGEVEVTAGMLNPQAAAGSPEALPAASREPARPDMPLARGGVSAEGPEPLKIVLGLSLIANLALLFMWRRAAGGNDKIVAR